MTRKVASLPKRPPRIAIIAPTLRNREYARRAFRLLGTSVLVFLSVEEFLEIGERAHELSMVYLEHSVSSAPSDARTLSAGEKVRNAVGNAMPVVHSIAVQSGGAVPGFKGNDVLLPSSLFFAQLCRALRAFMQKNGLAVNERQLEWDEYRFCIDSGLIFVRGKPVVVKQDEFDLALELFFNVDSRVSRSWLTNMVPSLQALRKRATAPAADATLIRLGDLLSLKPAYGWDLVIDSGSSCVLAHSTQTASA